MYLLYSFPIFYNYKFIIVFFPEVFLLSSHLLFAYMNFGYTGYYHVLFGAKYNGWGFTEKWSFDATY